MENGYVMCRNGLLNFPRIYTSHPEKGYTKTQFVIVQISLLLFLNLRCTNYEQKISGLKTLKQACFVSRKRIRRS